MSTYEITVLNTDGSVHGTAATPNARLLDLLGTWPGRWLSTGLAGAIQIRRPDGTTGRRDAFHGACGNPVPSPKRRSGPVRPTCTVTTPASRNPGPRITSELQDQAGICSGCGEDSGFGCYQRMPLHAACHDHGPY